MGIARKVLKKENQLSTIFKFRFGKKYGLTLIEMIIAFYGDKKITEKRKIELSLLRKSLRKERIRNIIPEYIHKQTPVILDDTDISVLHKFGKRNIANCWIFYQPDNLKDVNTYKNFCDVTANSIEKSGELAFNNTYEQITKEKTLKQIEKIITK